MTELAVTSEITPSAFGDITIGCDARTGAHIYWQNGACQSEADLHGISYAPYAHALFGFLLQTTAGEREPVLMIGCGGGSMAAMLHRAGRAVEIVDVDPVSFTLARRHFGLPDSIPCHVADGVDFLRGLPDVPQYSAIIVDAFLGASVPEHFLGDAFFLLCASRLRGGFTAMNVLETSDNHAQLTALIEAIAARLAESGQGVRIFEEAMPGEQNLLLLAGEVAALQPPVLVMPPYAAEDELRADLARMRFRPLPGEI